MAQLHGENRKYWQGSKWGWAPPWFPPAFHLEYPGRLPEARASAEKTETEYWEEEEEDWRGQGG